MNHSFNIKIAELFGLEEAIMIENMNFWIQKNEANKKHFYDGKYWTYNSMRAFAQLFPYWTQRQIERILKSLETKQCIETGNYNKIAYDRTKWYAITETVKCIYANGEMDITKHVNGFTQTVEPIPDINTNINSDVNSLKNIKKEKSVLKTRRKKKPPSELQKYILDRKTSFIKQVSEIYPKDKTCKEGFRRLEKFYDEKILFKGLPTITKNNEIYFTNNLKACLELQTDLQYMYILKNYVGTDSKSSKNYHEENFIEKLEYQNKNKPKSKTDATQHYAHSGNAAEERKQARETAEKLWSDHGIATEGFIFDM